MVRVKVYHKPMPRRLQTIQNRLTRNIAQDNDLYVASDELNAVSKYNKPAPKNIYDTSDTKHNAVAQHNVSAQHSPPPSYKASLTPSRNDGNDDDDVYVYANVKSRDVIYGEKIAEGKFAVINKAQIKAGNKTRNVAAKSLKSGFSQDDVELMSSKIVFLKDTVQPHLGIVRYVGETTDETRHVPVLLMELCDMPLLDWLKKIQTVDVDVLENMLTFCLGIARAVEHLHSQKIIHKRLGARNVLLTKTINGYIPKLIGFGPSKSDRATNQKVPKKWLAPETLKTLTSDPVYDTKTDAWAFAVVMCEIYSKGGEPYPDVKSDDVLSYLQKGKRMKRPDHFPTDLFNMIAVPCWNEKPSARPRFDAICRDIEDFRSGSGGEGQGYYAPGEELGSGKKSSGSDSSDEAECYDDAK